MRLFTWATTMIKPSSVRTTAGQRARRTRRKGNSSPEWDAGLFAYVHHDCPARDEG